MIARILDGIPRGHLPEELWRTRHQLLLWVLFAHLPFLVLFGLANDWSLLSSLAAVTPTTVLGVGAVVTRGHRSHSSSLAALGLLSCSAALVVLWHGTIEAHFHYFVMTAALAMYEEWVVYGLAVSYVVLQHAIMATISEEIVFAHLHDDHGMWFWPLIHGGFIAAQSVANIVMWRASQAARQQATDAFAEVRHQAEHDALTGLVNRREFARRLSDELKVLEPGEMVGVLFVDLDDFKLINDSLGHGVGDELLIAVAQRLCAELRADDTLGRFGGDEFVACVTARDSEIIQRVADRMIATLEQPITFGDQQRRVGASVGVAVATDPEADADGLIRDADAAMYVAKRRGKGRRQIFDGRLRADALERRARVLSESGVTAAPESLEVDEPATRRSLAEVLRNRSVLAVYQPIVSVHDRETVGFEALARGPAGTALETPLALFEAARRAGRMGELDWVCREAAIDGARAVNLHRPLKLFVNIEPAGLTTPCPEHLLVEWERAGQDLGLVAEITERALTERPAELLRAVADFRRRGWGIALDDVGADVRSIALMPLLRPDVIKLDLRLIQSRDSNEVAEIINAVNAESERTGALVLAEGVETEEQFDRARAMGATLAQGWLFGRPGPLPSPATSPEHPLVLTAPEFRSSAHTPYQSVTARVPARRGNKSLLMSITRMLEYQAASLGDAGVIASAFQTADRFTPQTGRRYELLAADAALVVALGVGMDAEPAPGVRGASLATNDPLLHEWSVVVIGPHFSAALVAVDLGDTGPDSQRRFDFALTYDRTVVAAAAQILLERVAPVDRPARPGRAPSFVADLAAGGAPVVAEPPALRPAAS